MESTYLTPQGYEELKIELEQLKQKRIEISKRIEEAKSLGDLSENADYTKSKEEQSFNEGKIRGTEALLSRAEIIQKDARSDEVQVGSTIDVENGGTFHSYMIVGSREADPLDGKISNESPLGKEFLGKKVGEKVKVETPNGTVTYSIKAIH